MSDDRALYRKYHVERTDGKPLKGGAALVLEFGDPKAHSAIREFARSMRDAGFDALADDLDRSVGSVGEDLDWIDGF